MQERYSRSLCLCRTGADEQVGSIHGRRKWELYGNLDGQADQELGPVKRALWCQNKPPEELFYNSTSIEFNTYKKKMAW